MKILTILIGTLVLNMFHASNCRADETATEAMLRAESLADCASGCRRRTCSSFLDPQPHVVSWCSRKRTETEEFLMFAV